MDLFDAKTPEEVDLAILTGQNVNSINYKGYTPLHKASKKGYLNIIKKLCSLGANINAMDYMHDKPVDYAAKYGHLDIVKFFIENYGIISNRLLCNSLVNESVDVFDFVLTLNPDLDICVDMKINDKYTCLYALGIACYLNNIYCVNKLLYAGANVNIIDEYKQNSLIIVCKNSQNIEQAHGIVKHLLFFGIDIDYQSDYSCLHYVCKNKNMLDILKTLISQNANINLVTNEIKTPLIIACFYSNYEYIPYLLKAGANVDVKDNHGNYALDYCKDRVMQRLIINHSKKNRTVVMMGKSIIFL